MKHGKGISTSEVEPGTNKLNLENLQSVNVKD